MDLVRCQLKLDILLAANLDIIVEMLSYCFIQIFFKLVWP